MVPALAVLFTASVAVLAWCAFIRQEAEEESVRAENRQAIDAAVRAPTPRKRSRSAIPPSGALIAAPADQRDVRAMVDYCDTASAAEIAGLRDVALHAPDALAAGNAVRALGRLHAVAKDADLVRLLDDPRERVRDETILALGESRSASTLERLEPLLRAGDQHVRVLAIRAIGRVGGERARRILSAVADDPAGTPEIAAFARAGLAASSGR
jgi:hypothetical protein